MNQPILVNPNYPQELEAALNDFICNIFEQPLEKAYRRSRVYWPKRCDDYLARAVDGETLTLQNLIARILQKIKDKIVGTK
jgi:hypothetical protein